MFAVSEVHIRVDGVATAFVRLERGDAWIALGTWNGFAVELEADHHAAGELSLRPVTGVPDT